MTQILFALMVALTITLTWIGRNAAQPPAPRSVLSVLTPTALPDKRDQGPTGVKERTQVRAATKGIPWFKVGADSATGEMVAGTWWDSQADIDAFLTSDARKAVVEKPSALTKGEPTAEHDRVSEAKK
jgi:hypothetical protein